MDNIEVYQVYEDNSDFSGQDYYEHGYFRKLDNAVSKWKELLHSNGVGVDQVIFDKTEFLKDGFYTYESNYGVYGICKISFDD